MATTFTGPITRIEVEDAPKTARVESGPANTFKLTTDSDSSFETMVSVLTVARTNPFLQVTIEYAGADKEIDKITF